MPEQASIRSAPSTFVCRSRPLAELCTGLDETRNGQGRLFLLTGEPGIGKSRLADEVAAQAASRAMAVLRAQCWEDGGTPAYWPFVQLIRAALAGPDHDALLKSWSAANVAQDFAQFIPELKPKEPLLAQGSIQGSVDARHARFRLFDSVSAMLKSFASLRALLLIVEDLHAADQALLQMLRFVVNQLRGSAVMVLATYRGFEMQRSPALSPHIGGLIRQGTEIPLVALSQDDAARMIEDRAGSPSSPRMVSDIYQATAGNPLFIDGLVRVLSAEGRLGGTSRLNLAAFRVPDGVREAIRRWLDLLSNRPVLVIAAAIGQQFELKCLQRVTQAAHHELLDALRDASDMGVGNRALARRLLLHACLDSQSPVRRTQLRAARRRSPEDRPGD
jgi:predicted ATPase